jgi:hypothetical protein
MVCFFFGLAGTSTEVREIETGEIDAAFGVALLPNSVVKWHPGLAFNNRLAERIASEEPRSWMALSD